MIDNKDRSNVKSVVVKVNVQRISGLVGERELIGK